MEAERDQDVVNHWESPPCPEQLTTHRVLDIRVSRRRQEQLKSLLITSSDDLAERHISSILGIWDRQKLIDFFVSTGDEL